MASARGEVEGRAGGQKLRQLVRVWVDLRVAGGCVDVGVGVDGRERERERGRERFFAFLYVYVCMCLHVRMCVRVCDGVGVCV